MTTLSSDWPQCREHVSAWSIKRKVENRTRWKKQEEETVATETSCFPRSFWACSKKSAWAWPQLEGEINSDGVLQQKKDAKKMKSGLFMRRFGWADGQNFNSNRRKQESSDFSRLRVKVAAFKHITASENSKRLFSFTLTQAQVT